MSVSSMLISSVSRSTVDMITLLLFMAISNFGDSQHLSAVFLLYFLLRINHETGKLMGLGLSET